MLDLNKFEFTYKTKTQNQEELKVEIQDIVTEGTLQLFKMNNVSTDGVLADIKAQVLEKKPLENDEFEYTIQVEVTDYTEEAEIIE